MQMSGLDPTSSEEIMGIQLPTALPSRANTLVGARHPKWMVWDSIPGEKELQGEKGSAQAQTLSLQGDGAQPTSTRQGMVSPPGWGWWWDCPSPRGPIPCHRGGSGAGDVLQELSGQDVVAGAGKSLIPEKTRLASCPSLIHRKS